MEGGVTTTQGFLYTAKYLHLYCLQLSRFNANLKQLIRRYSINDQYIFQYFSLQAKCLPNVADEGRKMNEPFKKRLKVYYYSKTETKDKQEQME